MGCKSGKIEVSAKSATRIPVRACKNGCERKIPTFHAAKHGAPTRLFGRVKTSAIRNPHPWKSKGAAPGGGESAESTPARLKSRGAAPGLLRDLGGACVVVLLIFFF